MHVDVNMLGSLCCEGNVVPSTFASEFDTRKALYWKDPLLYANWSSQK